MRHFLSRLRSYFIFDPLIFLYTAFFGAASLLLSFFDQQGRTQHRIAVLWSRLILKTSMCPVTVMGLEQLNLAKPCVYAANHLSALDIPLLYASLPVQFRIVANKYLFRYPFVGWHLKRSGQIPIDPSTPRATFKSLQNGIDDLKNGLSVVIFPEGGRSPDGQLKAFMNGAFYMATKAQVDVVPLAIVGAFEVLPMNTFHIRPRRMELRIGAPISTTGMTTHDLEKISERTKNAIEEMYSAPKQQASPSQRSD